MVNNVLMHRDGFPGVFKNFGVFCWQFLRTFRNAIQKSKAKLNAKAQKRLVTGDASSTYHTLKRILVFIQLKHQTFVVDPPQSDCCQSRRRQKGIYPAVTWVSYFTVCYLLDFFNMALSKSFRERSFYLTLARIDTTTPVYSWHNSPVDVHKFSPEGKEVGSGYERIVGTARLMVRETTPSKCHTLDTQELKPRPLIRGFSHRELLKSDSDKGNTNPYS